jgi:hypothetical protein
VVIFGTWGSLFLFHLFYLLDRHPVVSQRGIRMKLAVT